MQELSYSEHNKFYTEFLTVASGIACIRLPLEEASCGDELSLFLSEGVNNVEEKFDVRHLC